MSAPETSQENRTGNPLAGFGPNEWIVEEIYQRFLADPSSVDTAWHEFFADYQPAPHEPPATPPATDKPAKGEPARGSGRQARPGG